ncbi:YkvA family protein [Methylophaga sp.]|uniref:YkvA family protein n=1 Tax=Methylophaga sp. TaxID=2024840 RepID=UPI003F69DAF1
MASSLWSKQRWQTWASKLTLQGYALYFTWQDPRSPKLVKLLAWLTIAYLFSPIDLIPDFIPVLGLLDDLLLVPIMCWLVIKLVPNHIWQDNLERAQTRTVEVQFRWMGAVIVIIWLLVILLLGMSLYHYYE